MKEFNLEEAKHGKPVCLRDGREARIVSFDKKGGNYPIVALVEDIDGVERVNSYDMEGRDITCDALDLMMAGEKKEGWVNVYKDNGKYVTGSTVWADEATARNEATKNQQIKFPMYIATIKIGWEE